MRRMLWFLLLALTPACGRHPHIAIAEIASTDTAGWAHDVALEDDHLYVSDRQGGYLVVARSLLWNRARVFTPVTDVISLAPHAGEPVLAARFEGLVLIGPDGSVSARYANGDIANAVVTRGDLAFVAYGLHGLVVARLAKGGIQVLSQSPSQGWSHDVKLSGDQALLADWNFGLRVLDIRDPLRPVEVAALKSPATAISVAVREREGQRVAAIAEGHAGVSFVLLNDQGHPSLLSRNSLGLNPADPIHPESGGWAHSVAWSGRYVFVANWKRGLTVLDAGDLSNPRVIREIPTNGTALGVRTELQPDGSWLVFLADGEAGFKIYRFTGKD